MKLRPLIQQSTLLLWRTISFQAPHHPALLNVALSWCFCFSCKKGFNPWSRIKPVVPNTSCCQPGSPDSSFAFPFALPVFVHLQHTLMPQRELCPPLRTGSSGENAACAAAGCRRNLQDGTCFSCCHHPHHPAVQDVTQHVCCAHWHKTVCVLKQKFCISRKVQPTWHCSHSCLFLVGKWLSLQCRHHVPVQPFRNVPTGAFLSLFRGM